MNQVKKNETDVVTVPESKRDNVRVVVSNVNVSNKMAEKETVVIDKGVSSHVAKQKNSDVKVSAKLSSNNIIVSNKTKSPQTSPVGKQTKLKQTIKNDAVHATNESEIVMKEVNTSTDKTHKIVKKTNVPIIQQKNTNKNNSDKVNESAVVMNDNKKKREREQTVLTKDVETFEIPRKKKVKSDLKVSNELKKPPNNDVEAKQNINNNNKSPMIKTIRSLNNNNKNKEKKHSIDDEANVKRAIVAKTQLFGDTVMTEGNISQNHTTHTNEPNVHNNDIITPKQPIQTKTIVSRETIDEKLLTYDKSTKSNANELNNTNNEDENDDDSNSNETDIGKKPKIGNREMAGLKFAREYGKETFHVMDDPASDSNTRSTRKKLQLNEKGSAHGT